MPDSSLELYGYTKRGAVVCGAGGYLIESATCGDSRSRSRRLGSGRMGLLGKIEDVESGDIVAEYPVIHDSLVDAGVDDFPRCTLD